MPANQRRPAPPAIHETTSRSASRHHTSGGLAKQTLGVHSVLVAQAFRPANDAVSRRPSGLPVVFMKRTLALVTMSLAVWCGLATNGGAAQQPPAAPAQPPGRGGGRGGPAVVSPQIESDGRVTFRILAPNATAVSVGGDINGSL